MSLHSIHRAASTVKHRTKASLKKVFGSPAYYSCAPHLSRRRRSSSAARENDRKQVRSLPTSSVGSTAKNHEKSSRKGKSFVDEVRSGREHSEVNSVQERSDSEEEGYVTAGEDSFDVGDAKSAKSSDVSKVALSVVNDHEPYLKRSVSGRFECEESTSEEEARDPTSQVLYEFRISVADSEEYVKKVDDATLMRFLIARNMDVAKASDMFIKDWKWRDQFAPRGYIAEDSVLNQLEAQKAFLQGLDKRGRPLIVIQGSKHYSRGRDMDEFKRYCFYCIEKVIANIPRGMDKFVTIFDLRGTGYRNLDTSATIVLVDFLQAHYPERMAQLFVVHFPAMFQGVYKLVESAIDMRTRKKIMFVTDGEMETVLRREIGDECLPKAYGGYAELVPIQYASINRDLFPCQAVWSQ